MHLRFLWRVVLLPVLLIVFKFFINFILAVNKIVVYLLCLLSSMS